MLRWAGIIACAASLAACSSSVGASTSQAIPVIPASLAPAAASCLSPISTLSDPNGTHGLYVWIHNFLPASEQAAINKYVIPDPTACGASIVVLWSQVDNGPGAATQYDFTSIEKAIGPWAKAGKPVNLLFAGASETGTNDTATPKWVLAQTGSNAVPLVSCPDPGASQKASAPAPVYWDQGYATPYRAFIAQVMKRFNNDPRIGYMRFGIGMGVEDYVQHGADGACAPTWAPYGLTGFAYWAAFSKDMVAYIKSLHPKKQIIIAINNFAGDGAPDSPNAVPNVVASAAAPRGIGFGTLNLGAFDGAHIDEPCMQDKPFPPYWCRAFNAHKGVVPLLFQPITYAFNPDMPAVAPLGQLLAYAQTNQAQVFELYPNEWLGADDPQWPTYAAHRAYLAKTLQAAAAWVGGFP
jgi:hypothetical protein